MADVFESAEKLGLKVIRMWAFNDGDGWNALQPRIGQIDDHVLRFVQGLACTRAMQHLVQLPSWHRANVVIPYVAPPRLSGKPRRLAAILQCNLF